MAGGEGNVSLNPIQDFLPNFTSSFNSSKSDDVGDDVTSGNISIYVELVLAAIGILANSLVIFVIARYREMRTVPNIFVLNLAVADLLYCCKFVPVWNSQYFTSGGWVLGQTVCAITRALYGICGNASILFVIAMSVERYQAVADPIGHHQRSSRKRTWLISTGLWVLSVVFTVHIIAFSKVIKPYGTGKFCGSDPSVIGVSYDDYIRGALIYRFVAWCLLPLSILVPCYTRLYYILHRGEALLHGPGQGGSRQRVTRMVTVVVVVFSISWMPLHIVSMVKYAFKLYTVPPGSTDHLELFVAMLSSVNSMINPFLYALLGNKFRVYMKAVICCGRGADKGSGYTPSSTRGTQLSHMATITKDQPQRTAAPPSGKTAETELKSLFEKRSANN